MATVPQKQKFYFRTDTNSIMSRNTFDPFDCTFEAGIDTDGGVTAIDWSSSGFDAFGLIGGEASVVQEGRILGKEAGLEAGFREGWAIGERTGVDLGMEIGFAMGLAEAVRTKLSSDEQNQSSSSSSLDRIRKSVEELEKAIADFPSSETEIRNRLFRRGNDRKSNINYELDGEWSNNDSSEEQHQLGEEEEDVRAKLQRIRARSKVLTAKLGIPRHSLKTVMAEAAKRSATAGILEKYDDVAKKGGNDETTQEW